MEGHATALAPETLRTLQEQMGATETLTLKGEAASKGQDKSHCDLQRCVNSGQRARSL